MDENLRAALDQLSRSDRSAALALHALLSVVDDQGVADFNEAAKVYRDDHLSSLRAKGKDVEREAGLLGLDQVRDHLATSVFPRLVGAGLILLPEEGLLAPDAKVRVAPALWQQIQGNRHKVAESLRETGEHAQISERSGPFGEAKAGLASVLEASGLVKMYRRRKVVNDVALRLQQGEIVGLLGPNGAGKTTTFYMIVGLIPPMAGRITLDGQDITSMPMYRRARLGIGYLSQEPSIFRKLSVEDNILAILETLPLSAAERSSRLEQLLDELSIKHLRESKAFSLSGGERRRLEITRALVTQPKFMMLDEPFAGVDPIAVHDIQQIVASLKTRQIGVLISDHNVEQTLDIVDRAYIMFDGRVMFSGRVRDLVFDDTAADIYLGPTLTSRLRARFASEDDGNSSAMGATA
ncbi:MAG TPA: LPS export ABC transporter ATP-binding protein [Gemmatimonadaceae bacterium]|nr:LPS export ABC transporter ATP-binding protein [Gemmatimonadaceae bacterium]